MPIFALWIALMLGGAASTGAHPGPDGIVHVMAKSEVLLNRFHNAGLGGLVDMGNCTEADITGCGGLLDAAVVNQAWHDGRLVIDYPDHQVRVPATK